MSVYGIDLGTTNSLLGQGDRLLTGLVPSIVDLQAKKVGSDERENVDAVRSFKVDISCGDEGLQSVLASAAVLQELKDKQDCVVELSVLLPYLLSSMITSVRQL